MAFGCQHDVTLCVTVVLCGFWLLTLCVPVYIAVVLHEVTLYTLLSVILVAFH